MIRFYNSEQVDNEKVLVEIACLSTDSKPTDGIAFGSLALELDTKKFYYFDGSAWAELGTGSTPNIDANSQV